MTLNEVVYAALFLPGRDAPRVMEHWGLSAMLYGERGIHRGL